MRYRILLSLLSGGGHGLCSWRPHFGWYVARVWAGMVVLFCCYLRRDRPFGTTHPRPTPKWVHEWRRKGLVQDVHSWFGVGKKEGFTRSCVARAPTHVVGR